MKPKQAHIGVRPDPDGSPDDLKPMIMTYNKPIGIEW